MTPKTNLPEHAQTGLNATPAPISAGLAVSA